MTPARKRRIWLAWGGRCACGLGVPVMGPGVIYDHDIQLWMEGPEDDENVRPLCAPCNRAKTAADAGARAKVRRLWAKAAFQPREPSGIPSRPFLPWCGEWAPRPFSDRSRIMKKAKTANPPAPKPKRLKLQVGPTRPAFGALLKPDKAVKAHKTPAHGKRGG